MAAGVGGGLLQAPKLIRWFAAIARLEPRKPFLELGKAGDERGEVDRGYELRAPIANRYALDGDRARGEARAVADAHAARLSCAAGSSRMRATAPGVISSSRRTAHAIAASISTRRR